MLTLIEGVAPVHSTECGCGGTNCDGSGFPDECVVQLFKHDESGHHWAFVTMSMTRETQATAIIEGDPLSAMMFGLTIERLLSMEGDEALKDRTVARAYVASSEGVIPTWAETPLLGVDIDAVDHDEAIRLISEKIESFHALAHEGVTITDDDLSRFIAGE